MQMPKPSIARRLLPLLDIVFILLAFFIILPQGVAEKKQANRDEKESSPLQKDLNTSRFIYVEIEGKNVVVEYSVMKNGKLKKEQIPFLASQFHEGKFLTIPQKLKRIIEEVRGQVKQRDSKEEILMVLSYDVTFYDRAPRTALVNFATINGLPYANVPQP